MALVRVSSYRGPACPRCRTPMELGQIQQLGELGNGVAACPRCHQEFEARIFHPATRNTRVLQLAHSGPEEAGACANHPRNAAVTNCGRCGIFICTLCQLEVDGATYCPACFERLAQEGSIESARVRFRDYGSLALFVSLIGLFFSIAFIGVPLGFLTFYYVFKGARMRSEAETRLSPLWIATLIAIVDIAIGIALMVGLFHKR